jgi:hypothetical protein
MIRLFLLLLLLAAALPARALVIDRLWYCYELDSAGLRYHFGRWTQQRFKVENHPVQQRNFKLDLGSFGMLAEITECSFDYKAAIISCTDRYTLFNLNIKTGRAAMSHVLGWVNQDATGMSVPNDLSVSAIQCKSLIPAPGIE